MENLTKKRQLLELGKIFKDMGKFMIYFMVANFILTIIFVASDFEGAGFVFSGVTIFVLNLFLIYTIISFYFDVAEKFKILGDLEEIKEENNKLNIEKK